MEVKGLYLREQHTKDDYSKSFLPKSSRSDLVNAPLTFAAHLHMICIRGNSIVCMDAERGELCWIGPLSGPIEVVFSTKDVGHYSLQKKISTR